MSIDCLCDAGGLRQVGYFFTPNLMKARHRFASRGKHRLLRERCLGGEVGKLVQSEFIEASGAREFSCCVLIRNVRYC